MTDAVASPAHPLARSLSSVCRVNGVESRFRARSRVPWLALRLTLDHDRGCFLPIPAYPRLLRAPASRRFPCSVRAWLAPRAPCRESPVFHDTIARRSEPAAIEGGISSSVPRACEPISGCPCRALRSGSRLPRGEPRCQPALADDTRGESRDRFHRRSVKTDDFRDPGHLPSWSTLRGCSALRVTLPSPRASRRSVPPRRRIARG